MPQSGIPIVNSLGTFNIYLLLQEPGIDNFVEVLKEPVEQMAANERLARHQMEQLKLSQPQAVKVQVIDTNSVSITWRQPDVTEIHGQSVVGYEVYRQEGNIRDSIDLGKLLGKIPNLSFRDNSAVKGKLYVYSVVLKTKDFDGLAVSAAPIKIP